MDRQSYPALNDDDSVVRTSFGIGQTAYTPADLSNRNPPEYELPYAGSLTGSLSWQSFNQTSARMFQVTVGILGEESLSGQLQIYSHNELDMGEDPRGWDSQRETEPLVNIAYQLNHSLIKSKNLTDRWAGQLSLSSRLSLGNLTTDATTGLSLRYGWNILEGFTVTSEPTGTGLLHFANLPKPSTASPHSIELVVGGTVTALLYSVFYDGSLISGDQRDVKRDNIILSGLIGLNYHYSHSFSIRAHYLLSSHLLKQNRAVQMSADRTQPDRSFGSVMIDYHF